MPQPTVKEGAKRVEVPKKEPAILSINFVDKDNRTLPGTSIQYVNLPQDKKYVDVTNGPVKHITQLGQKLKFKVKFNQEGSYKFKVKLEPKKDSKGVSKNVEYTAAEKGRNTNFKYQEKEKEYTTDSNGEKVIDISDTIFVTPAGGDVFILSATATEGKKNTMTLEIITERMMYYAEFKMPVIKNDCAQNLNIFKEEYKKHGIIFQGLPPVTLTKDRANIGKKEQDTFKEEVQDAYKNSTVKDKDPYCIAVAYTGHLAVKDEKQEIPVRVTGGSETPVTVDIRYNKEKHYLWNNIDSDDWFVDCYFVADGAINAMLDFFAVSDTFGYGRHPISKSKITLNSPAAGSNRVSIDISSLPKEKGTITLTVNCVSYMRGGLSFGGTNIIAICTRGNWKTQTTQEQNNIIVHEAGHQINMVTDGDSTKKLPDKTPNYYIGKGHQGHHCNTGLTNSQKAKTEYKTSEDTSSQCVMYGATNGKSAFCPECAKAVKKMDLSKGVKK